MSDFISTLAQQAGLDSAVTQKGVGALLATLQEQLPGDTFSKVSSAIPNAGGLLSAFQSLGSGSQPSVQSTVAGLAGGILGGKADAAASVISQFSKAGFTMDMIKTFLPVALGFLRGKLSSDVMGQVESGIPGLSGLLGGDTGGMIGKIKNLFN